MTILLNTTKQVPISNFRTPQFITSNEKITDEISFDFILSKPELENVLNEVSETLKHPTTIIEFKNKNEEEERTDPTRSRTLFNYCCETFRIVGDSDLCTICDKEHAYLFANVGLAEGQWKQIIENKINDEQYFSPSYNNPIAGKPQFSKHRDYPDREYLQYDCPIMGLRELIFPVIVERIILGVLFVGQVQIDTPDDKTNIQMIRRNFLDTFENVFSEYLKEFHDDTDVTIERIKNELMRLDDPRQREDGFKLPSKKKMPGGNITIHNPVPIPKDKYDEFISEKFEAVKYLEVELQKRLFEKRKKYIESVFGKALSENYKQIHRGLPESDINANDYTDITTTVTDYWDAIKENLKNILPKLDLQYISIFATKLPKTTNNKSDALNLVAYVSNNDEKQTDDNINTYSFDLKYFDTIEERDSNIRVFTTLDLDTPDTKMNKKLFNCIRVGDRKNNIGSKDENRDVFFCPVRIDMDCSVAVVIGYQDHNTSKELSAIKKQIGDGVLQLITQIVLIPAFLQNAISKENTEKTFRIYRHEITQLTLGLRSINDYYLKKPHRRILYATDKQLDDTYNDNRSSLERLNNFSQNAGRLVSLHPTDKPKKEEFMIFKELLYKWRMIYRRDAYDKNIEFVLPVLYFKDKQRPLINSNKEELEHLIYNLIGNAMKYSYWGTRIHIDCKILPHNPGKQCLSITDYGYEIEKGEAPYGLYYRNKELTKYETEGNGIGLYVAREIANSLDITLAHKVECISKLNVPLLHRYIHSANKNATYYQRVERAYAKLYESGILEDVLSRKTSFSPVRDEQVFETIDWPTYKVTFEVII